MKNVLIGLIKIGFLVLLCVFITHCGSHKTRTTQGTSLLQQAQAIKAFYLENWTEDVYLKRCDKLTFKALFSAFSGVKQDYSDHEIEDGHYVRDPVNACYPHDSASTISPDPYIMMMNDWWTHEDYDSVDRAIEYAEDNWFKVGEGPWDLVTIAHLMPMMYSLRGDLESHKTLLTQFELNAIEEAIDKALSGFRSRLLALYIHLSGRKDGRINTTKLQLLQETVENEPEAPILHAIYNTYVHGHQDTALRLVLDNCPADELPMDDGAFGWGSAPKAVLCVVTVGIIEENL